MTNSSKIWFITGISGGLGKALADAALAQGDTVVGTFRQTEQAEAFTASQPDRTLGLVLDVTNLAQIPASLQTAVARFGRIDVLVNNAGFGFVGAVEETSMAEVRTVFETNLFGALAVTQAALPILRQQRSGHILQMSSHSGFKGFAGFGIYGASKFALEGFSEALADEVKPLGIKVTIIEPGPFRTGFGGDALGKAQTVIADYDPTAGAFRQRMVNVNGQQEGDPVKAADAIVALVNSENPPLRLPLGKIATITLANKLASVQADLDAGRETAINAVFMS